MARDVADTDDVCKPQRNRRNRDCWQWYRHYPQQWLNGTRHLSPLARAAYADILSLIYLDADGRIPDSNKWIACALHYRAKQWRTARGELFATGKLFARDGYVYNAKANEVHAERVETAERVSTTKGKKPRLGSVVGAAREARKSPERDQQVGLPFGTIFNEFNGGVSTESESESEVIETLPTVESPIPVEQAVVGVAAAPKMDLKVLRDKLMDAADGALASLAIAQGLENLMIPLMWVESGCDLDRDILPTIKTVSASCKARGQKVKTWKYYSEAVAEAKAVREAGLPTIHRSPLTTPPNARRKARIDAAANCMTIAKAMEAAL